MGLVGMRWYLNPHFVLYLSETDTFGPPRAVALPLVNYAGAPLVRTVVYVGLL